MVTKKELNQKLDLLLLRQSLIGAAMATTFSTDKQRKEFCDNFNKMRDIAMEKAND